jgi:hypothetical protein
MKREPVKKMITEMVQMTEKWQKPRRDSPFCILPSGYGPAYLNGILSYKFLLTN